MCRQGVPCGTKPSSPAGGYLCSGTAPLTDEIPEVKARQDLRDTRRKGRVSSDLMPWYPLHRAPHGKQSPWSEMPNLCHQRDHHQPCSLGPQQCQHQ